jgi:dihydroorotate dehydrogenase (NAD+) catalytic subunit
MLAGADMVAIGTANFSEPFAIPTILNDLTEYVRKNKLKSISELKGGAFQC